MSENIGRVFGGFAALAVLWIVVYWWWEPSQPRISFDPATAAAAGSAGNPTPPTVVSQSPPRPVVTEPNPAPPVRVVDPPRPAPQAPEPPKVAVVPPQFRQYTVKAGDTLASIAAKELGSGKYAEAISRANPLADLERLKPGRTINIPLDPKNIQGKPVEESPGTPAPTGAAAEPQVTEYTVKSGDTLSEIAKALYGSTSYKDALYEANKDRLESEDALKVGQKLRVPPKK